MVQHAEWNRRGVPKLGEKMRSPWDEDGLTRGDGFTMGWIQHAEMAKFTPGNIDAGGGEDQ